MAWRKLATGCLFVSVSENAFHDLYHGIVVLKWDVYCLLQLKRIFTKESSRKTREINIRLLNICKKKKDCSIPWIVLHWNLKKTEMQGWDTLFQNNILLFAIASMLLVITLYVCLHHCLKLQSLFATWLVRFLQLSDSLRKIKMSKNDPRANDKWCIITRHCCTQCCNGTAKLYVNCNNNIIIMLFTPYFITLIPII